MPMAGIMQQNKHYDETLYVILKRFSVEQENIL